MRPVAPITDIARALVISPTRETYTTPPSQLPTQFPPVPSASWDEPSGQK
jgi:hypothetical protein